MPPLPPSVRTRLSRVSGLVRSAIDTVRGPTGVWVVVVALAFLAVTLQLMSSPEIALQYWYFAAVPMILAGFRFGRRAALITSILSVLLMMNVFRAAGHSFQQVTDLVGALLDASSSPDEARRFALQLADLRANDPSVAFQRAIVGLILVSIGATLLGAAVDTRNQAYRILEQVVRRLGRYFSPQLVEFITEQGPEGGEARSVARRDITILFTDLRDFTGLGEQLEPEEVVTLLNEYLEEMTDEVFREDGTLDKYIGDGIMAFFGDPIWYPDHSARAMRAALAMQRRMRELHSRWLLKGWPTVGMGIGMASGLATVGDVGSPSRTEYTAIGSTVNIAARLASAAQGGEILTTQRTYRFVQHLCVGVVRQPIMVKGFTQPVDIVEITGARLAAQEESDHRGAVLAEVISAMVDDPVYRASFLRNPEEAAFLPGLSEAGRDLVRAVAVLCGYPLLQGVPGIEVANLIRSASLEEYEQGTIMAREGSVEDRFYIMLSGDAAVTAIGEESRERHVASLARGDHFGEVGLIQNAARTATVRLISPSRLLVFQREGFFELLERAPTLRSRIESAGKMRLGELSTAS